MARDKTEMIVSFVQQGHEEYIPVLWESVERLVKWYANRYFIPKAELCARRGVEIDDLIQCGYFALIRCLKAYDPEKGVFTSLLIEYLRNEFNNAIGRTARQRGDPLNNCLSLDAELDSDAPDSESMYELVSDGRDYAGEIDEEIFQQQLHEALERALEELPEHEAATIRAEYWEGLSQAEIAEARSLPVLEIRNDEQRAMRKLRHGKRTRELEQYLDIFTPFYQRTGLGWHQKTGMSSVEYNVLLRDRKEREYESIHPTE